MTPANTALLEQTLDLASGSGGDTDSIKDFNKSQTIPMPGTTGMHVDGHNIAINVRTTTDLRNLNTDRRMLDAVMKSDRTEMP